MPLSAVVSTCDDTMCLGYYLVPCGRMSYTTVQEKHEENNSMGCSMHPSHD